MFEQHPVPQQISSYQFRLVGDMTLKQFFQIAAGAVLGLLTYASPLPAIFKWPLIVLFVLAGAAFAFLPLQERPLEQWLSAFIRSIYGPTIFIWQKSQKDVPYFAKEESTALGGATPTVGTATPDAHTANLEASEQNILSRISGLFSLTPRSNSTQIPVVQPVVSVKPQVQPVQSPQIPILDPAKQQATKEVSSSTIEMATLLSATKQTLVNPATIPVPARAAVTTPPTPLITVSEKEGFKQTAQTMVDPKTMQTAQSGNQHLSQTFSPTTVEAGTVAQFSDQAAPPSPPTTPNIIVGQVMDAQGKIVDGAIMEIKDQLGRPVRALKTNRAGHFMIVTPLPNGVYQMFVEKDGLTFETVNLTTNGTIIAPIAIRSTNNQ